MAVTYRRWRYIMLALPLQPTPNRGVASDAGALCNTYLKEISHGKHFR